MQKFTLYLVIQPVPYKEENMVLLQIGKYCTGR